MTAYYNDIDPFCCAILRRHIDSGELPPGVVDDRDIRTVDAEELMGYEQIHLFAGIGGFPLGLRMAGWPDDKPILTAGFPCQPVSVAGKRLGQEDERWLWPEVARVVRVVRPRVVLLENVPGLLARGMGDVLGDLAEAGYDAQWSVLRASDWGAPHKRERVFIVAYPNSERCGDICEKQKAFQFSNGLLPSDSWPWVCEPPLLGVAHGIPHRVDRLRALGNAVVPQVVAFVARMILAAEEVPA